MLRYHVTGWVFDRYVYGRSRQQDAQAEALCSHYPIAQEMLVNTLPCAIPCGYSLLLPRFLHAVRVDKQSVAMRYGICAYLVREDVCSLLLSQRPLTTYLFAVYGERAHMKNFRVLLVSNAFGDLVYRLLGAQGLLQHACPLRSLSDQGVLLRENAFLGCT